MKNEIIDKLKVAGYITVTDDSQGIADKVGVTGGSGGNILENNTYEANTIMNIYHSLNTDPDYFWNPNIKSVYSSFSDLIFDENPNLCSIYPDPSIVGTAAYDDLIKKIVTFEEIPNFFDDQKTVIAPVIDFTTDAPVNTIKNSGLADKIYVKCGFTKDAIDPINTNDLIVYCLNSSDDLKQNETDYNRLLELYNTYRNSPSPISLEDATEIAELLREYLPSIKHDFGVYKDDDQLKTMFVDSNIPLDYFDDYHAKIGTLNALDTENQFFVGNCMIGFITPYVFVDGVKTNINDIYDEIFSDVDPNQRKTIYGCILMFAKNELSNEPVIIYGKCTPDTLVDIDIVSCVEDKDGFIDIITHLYPSSLNIKDVLPINGTWTQEVEDYIYEHLEDLAPITIPLSESIFGYASAAPARPDDEIWVQPESTWVAGGITQAYYDNLIQAIEAAGGSISDESQIASLNTKILGNDREGWKLMIPLNITYNDTHHRIELTSKYNDNTHWMGVIKSDGSTDSFATSL